ncbi:MAG: PepSY domain-containing protein [Cyclobacteriaceae bacterium]|nr:PepSY domain-containing protein [Cyclobacteriaceae bacterium]
MKKMAKSMRVIHRYLGFFLAGIMTVYALSGMTLIFRDSDFMKQEKQIKKQIQSEAKANELGQLLGLRQLKVEKEEGNMIYFDAGVYDKTTGIAEYKVKELPYVLNKMTELHKARSQDPLFFLNIFFGLSLLFFVVSAFWMYMPTSTLKKGLYFAFGGMVLTVILLFI